MRKLITPMALWALACACTKEFAANQNQQSSTTTTSSATVANNDDANGNVQVVGNQQVIQLPIDEWGTPTNALLYLPDDYGKNKDAADDDDGDDASGDGNSNGKGKKKFALIFSLHGVGEAGTDITRLIRQGLPQRIANGFKPEGVNPVDGKTYEFIVVSPQAPSWSYQEQHLKYMFPELCKRYSIDKRRVYVTGYSAGGYGTWTCDTDDPQSCLKIAALVPISAAPIEQTPVYVDGEYINRYDSIPNAAPYGLAVWSICGDQDSFYGSAIDYTNRINGDNPRIAAKLTTMTGVGHWAWQQAYDPDWRVNGLNIYDWMLQYKRSK